MNPTSGDVYIDPKAQNDLLEALAQAAGSKVLHEPPPPEATIVGEKAVVRELSSRIDDDRLRDIEEEHRLIMAYTHAHNRATRRKAGRELDSFRRRMRKKYLGR